MQLWERKKIEKRYIESKQKKQYYLQELSDSHSCKNGLQPWKFEVFYRGFSGYTLEKTGIF